MPQFLKLSCLPVDFITEINVNQTSETVIHFISRVQTIQIGVETDEKLSKSLVSLIKVINFIANHEAFVMY